MDSTQYKICLPFELIKTVYEAFKSIIKRSENSSLFILKDLGFYEKFAKIYKLIIKKLFKKHFGNEIQWNSKYAKYYLNNNFFSFFEGEEKKSSTKYEKKFYENNFLHLFEEKQKENNGDYKIILKKEEKEKFKIISDIPSILYFYNEIGKFYTQGEDFYPYFAAENETKYVNLGFVEKEIEGEIDYPSITRSPSSFVRIKKEEILFLSKQNDKMGLNLKEIIFAENIDNLIEEKIKKEEENKKKEEENKKKEEENKKKEEENKKKEEENIKKEKENKKKEEENKKNEENIKKEEENINKKEENIKKDEENVNNIKEEENKKINNWEIKNVEENENKKIEEENKKDPFNFDNYLNPPEDNSLNENKVDFWLGIINKAEQDEKKSFGFLNDNKKDFIDPKEVIFSKNSLNSFNFTFY